MTDRMFPLTRRHLLAGIGGVAWCRAGAARSEPAGSGARALTLEAVPAKLPLREGQPDSAVWALRAEGTDPARRFRQGERLELTVSNTLPAPLALNWHGLDGLASVVPLMARSPLPPGGTDRLSLPLRQAGTFLCDARLLGDDLLSPSAACALIVAERTPAPVDRDELILIEDWRLGRDGEPVAPAKGAQDVPPLYTVNGKVAPLAITARVHERIRLRFINACQRNAIALRIEKLEARVMAIDSQPAEPFLARDGQMVLAPGTRIDAFVDVALAEKSGSTIVLHDGHAPQPLVTIRTTSEKPIRDAPLAIPSPLPSNGLPHKLDLKTALRVEMKLDGANGSGSGWPRPSRFDSRAAPAFRVKQGRTVVLTVTNAAPMPMAFHLHGHHVRLLDRLDDGWKPFWLDTLLIEAGRTHRMAFAAEFTGSWLMEAMAVQWGTPRLIRWFAVDQ